MITYEQFKELYDAIGGSPEFPIFFDEECEDEYMLIKCDDGPTFQKCFGDRYGELKFESLDDLYRSTMPDGICLEKDWGRIVRVMMGNAFFLEQPDELEDCWKLYAPLTNKKQ